MTSINLFIFYNSSWFVFIILTGVFAFSAVIIYDEKIRKKLRMLEASIKLYQGELNIGTTSQKLYDNGLKYLDKSHVYAYDLDLFGDGSLFQNLNRCHTNSGGYILANWLLEPSPEDNILDRQKATSELSKNVNFRKNVGVVGIINKTNDTLNDHTNWHGNTMSVRLLQKLKITATIFSILNIGLLIISFFNSSILLAFLSFFIFSYFYIYSFEWRKVKHLFDNISKADSSLKYYLDIISAIEKENFTTSLLIQLKNELKINKREGVKVIKSLQNNILWIDLRLNFLYQLFINSFFFTDIWLLHRIEKWKLLHGSKLINWQKSVGKFESLISLSVLHFNNPDWTFPIIEKDFKISLTNAGHPLIPANDRINNSYQIDKLSSVDLLTGSNMSGKSTFLRTVGVNIILALAGAVVCAERMSVSPLRLMTYMRIEDNLLEQTSTFYAEIKRLKQIMEESKKNEYVFLLLDELLRGTNSFDKRTGSIAIIKNIIKNKSSAIIATHDLSIANNSFDNNDNIRKYHFDIMVKENHMFFDYKLKEGVCQSTNASLLLKEIGIEV